MNFKLEQIASVADEIYFKFIDSLHDNVAVEYVETDPDNVGGTRNTEQGKDLYWSIEDTLREAFGKEDE